jgi:hypothetical protein
VARQHQINQQKVELDRFNLVQGCSLAVCNPDNLNLVKLIQLGA